MLTFPALSTTPTISDWNEGRAADPTMRSPTDGGYIVSRPRFTRVVRKWALSYSAGNALPLADKNTLLAFETSVNCGADVFTWQNPITLSNITVRFLGTITFKPQGTVAFWQAVMVLEEV